MRFYEFFHIPFLEDERLGGSVAVAKASNAQGRSKIVQGWDRRSPTGETFLREKESRRSFGI